MWWYRLRANSLLAALIAALCVGSFGAGRPAPTSAVGVPGSIIPESADFATLELRDPWDMDQYLVILFGMFSNGIKLDVNQ